MNVEKALLAPRTRDAKTYREVTPVVALQEKLISALAVQVSLRSVLNLVPAKN